MREPWSLPDATLPLPSPPKLPSEPPAINLLMILLPPVIMIVMSVVVGLITKSSNPMIYISMGAMSLGFPLANIISVSAQKRKYKKTLELRKEQYRATLLKEKEKIDMVAGQQRAILEMEYPAVQTAMAISLGRGQNPRLWWRRPYDDDFLSLRIGFGMNRSSFKLEMPRNMDLNDPAAKFAEELVTHFLFIPQCPILVDLKTAGSLAIQGRQSNVLQSVARRLVLDVLVHHSPEDVEVAVLADAIGAAERWAWLKWVPHTRALYSQQDLRRLSFTEDSANQFLIALMRLFNERKAAARDSSSKVSPKTPAVVVILDDAGKIRQIPDIGQLASEGFEYGIYLIFIGEQGSPRTCRARLSVDDQAGFKFLETWNIEGRKSELQGVVEYSQIDECDQAARALSGLEVVGGQLTYSLPPSVRISQILSGDDPLSLEGVKQNWSTIKDDSEMVLFPVGLYVAREGPEIYEIDFRPESKGGRGEYHALLIGTTGSGKSIFLQSLVLASAHRYSPRLLNFLFMDFKAGAAELKKISELPHVVGMVTDLSTELADRALQALENELARRQSVFDNAGKITDIWDFNTRFPDQAFPHLLTVIDEFAEGIKLLPDLVERLKDLGRRGRAFGMYFLLANQEVNNAVDSLKTNVGWYIVLKVKRNEEMSLIDKTLPIASGKGRGYIRVKSDIVQFQGAYGGDVIHSGQLEDVQEFEIQKVELDGSSRAIYKHTPHQAKLQELQGAGMTEQEFLVTSMNQALNELGLKPTRKIYMDPIPVKLNLSDVLKQSQTYRTFSEGKWSDTANVQDRLRAPIGMVDYPEDCVQLPMVVNFKEGDGHLWISGTPGSGKARTIGSLLLSLAACHTPDEIQFYILEYGAGTLRPFEKLPHCGAVIRLAEQERMERLLKYLEAEIDKRTSQTRVDLTGQPEIFVVINNFAEMRATYPDQADTISRFVRTGKGAGVHVIIATNRGSEVPRAISSNIARRIVLQMASRDEYLDVVGSQVQPLSLRAEGRGFWVGERISECQVALPAFGDEEEQQLPGVIQLMRQAWVGKPAKQIGTLAERITLTDMGGDLLVQKPGADVLYAPIGVAHDTLDLVLANFLEEMPGWLVLGPRQSGKSNFLMSVATGMGIMHREEVEVLLLGLRRGPLQGLAETKLPVKVCITPEEIIQQLEEVNKRPLNGNPKKAVLLIDDVVAAFEPGKEAIAAQLNALAVKMNSATDLYIMASGLRDELQNQVGAAFVRGLRQNRTGVAFSKDPSDMDWLGAQLDLSMRKINLPPGRGFYSSKGRLRLVQTILVDKESLQELK